MKVARTVAAMVLLAVTGGCVNHIRPYTPKRRQYELPSPPQPEGGQQSEGSLWSAGQPANYLFSDQRALMVNDVVVVKIKEESSAFSDATTKLEGKSEVKLGIDALMGFLAALQQANPNFDRSNIVSAGRKNDFAGSGSTSRRGEVKAVVPAIVRKVFPNGNLFIEGHRVILVNDEEYHFYISGLVRAIDIDESNSVDSTKIADAEIEFTGRGTVTEKQKPGWFSRGIDWIWPF
ncbi:MAG: flagellar basal body L-ring protein FlgH [Deltaproteobacteria bacterium]|nr:MAG: flagellar basal body L-ring protein FlgH [Deltaproteobacteria bacterium]